jgi:rhodanese-related sulfurtransferase
MKHLLIAFSVLSLLTLNALAGAGSDISLADLKKAVADKSVTLLDANGAESYKAAHIPGAVDYFSSEADIAKSLPADKGALIVAYCYSPACPAYKQAVTAAEKLGYTNVKHFPGGISGWKSAGEPVESAK